jgi:tRNA(Arg) A34 adenosine deaminase TadA
MDRELLRRAIALAVASVEGGGGPFGAVVARRGRILGEGTNRVTGSNDPTAHAEVEAVRAACAALGAFELSGCTVYASCEPCPMCLGALYWARVERIVYADGREDAARAGFDDAEIYAELARAPAERRIPMVHDLRDEGLAAFAAWERKTDKQPY